MLSTSNLNKLLLLLRFILCCWPLTGYIHPDEFFQSPEVAANDVLGFKTTRTWEWDATFPARSIIFPTLSSGLPFLLLKMIKSLFGIQFSSYVLLLLPRLWMTLLSSVTDIALGKMAEKIYIYNNQNERNQQRKDICILLFRSSAVTMVFLTRTFSNSFETILLALFLWRLLLHANQESFLKDLNATTIILSLITIFGFFIRPTFILFAAFGSLAYLLLCIKNRKIFSQAAIAVLTVIIAGLVFILIDSKYFSPVDEFKLSITPFNLIKYNLDETSLHLHGKHPRFLHLVVNCPLLFGPLFALFILATADVALFSYRMPKGKRKELNLIFLAASAWLAIFLLSYFKHQEPRYIIPIISAMSLVTAWTLERRPTLWKGLLRFWVTFNTALFAWFGFVHQGGIIPCLSHLNKEMSLRGAVPNGGSCIQYDLLFWYTYMAPQHLIPKPDGSNNTKITLYNLGSLPEHNVTELLKKITLNEKYIKMKCSQKVSMAMFDPD